jgi:hypothetical protein
MKTRLTTTTRDPAKDQTQLLEADNAAMEKKLAVMKNFIKNINSFKTLNEREFNKKVTEEIETTTAKDPVLPKAKAPYKIKPLAQSKAKREKSENPLSFLMSQSDHPEGHFDNLQRVLDQQMVQSYDLFDRVLESANLTSLKPRLLSGNISDFESLRHTSIEKMNELFITAGKQAKLKDAIDKLATLRLSNEENSQSTQVDFMTEEEKQYPNLEREIHQINHSMKMENFSKIDKNKDLGIIKENDHEDEDVINEKKEQSNFWYINEQFPFSDIIPIRSEKKENLPKALIRPSVCYSCYALFVDDKPFIQETVNKAFCSTQCESKQNNIGNIPSKNGVENGTSNTLDSNRYENVDNGNQGNGLPVDDIDLDFSFNL